jgi:hypothetical protein
MFLDLQTFILIIFHMKKTNFYNFFSNNKTYFNQLKNSKLNQNNEFFLAIFSLVIQALKRKKKLGTKMKNPKK